MWILHACLCAKARHSECSKADTCARALVCGTLVATPFDAGEPPVTEIRRLTMKQHAQQPHKPAAQAGEKAGERKSESKKGEHNAQAQQGRGGNRERAESDRAERTSMQHGTDQSAKRPMPVPAEDGRAAAQEGQMPQNQQRLGQHQNSRKQP
ncbi:hypothetical protein [Ralstonia sp. UNC404CL21Col]|nr:hypothetical protein [Ralstonia sp. UNC404CL21Col]